MDVMLLSLPKPLPTVAPFHGFYSLVLPEDIVQNKYITTKKIRGLKVQNDLTVFVNEISQ